MILTPGAHAIFTATVKYCRGMESQFRNPYLDEIQAAVMEGNTPVPSLEMSADLASRFRLCLDIFEGAKVQFHRELAAATLRTFGKEGGGNATQTTS